MRRAIERVKTVALLALLVAASCFALWVVALTLRMPDRARFAVPPPGKETEARISPVRADGFAVEADVIVARGTPDEMTGVAPCRFEAWFEGRATPAPRHVPLTLNQRARFGEIGHDIYVSQRVALAPGDYAVHLRNLGCAADAPPQGGVATAWAPLSARIPSPFAYQIAALAGLAIGLLALLAWAVMATIARLRR